MFLKKLFKKKQNIFFNYGCVDCLENPEMYSEEAIPIIENLNKVEKNKIQKTVEAFHSSLIPLFNFWKSNSYAFDIAEKDSTKLFKSYTELNIIEWMFLINMLRKSEVGENIIEALFYIIGESLDALGQNVYSPNNFKNFENALVDRSKIYPEILNYFINPRKNEVESYSNLFTLLIEKPMEKEIDLLSEHLTNFGELERMQSSMIFMKVLSKTISNFNKETENIW